MAYCTEAQVTNAAGGANYLKQLLDRDGDGTADVGVLDGAIAEADALIDTYASKRFSVPFAAPSTFIQMLSARLAVYALRRDRGMVGQAELTANENDLKWLKSLSDGDVLPGTDPVPTKHSIVRDAATPSSSIRDVSRCKLKGFA